MTTRSFFPPRVHECAADYEAYHTVGANVALHTFGVPMVVLGITGLLTILDGHTDIPVVGLCIAAVLAWYARIGGIFTFGVMAAVYLCSWVACRVLGVLIVPAAHPYLPFGCTAFAGFAMLMFGHFLEGKKPAFTKNLTHLLIGPLHIVLMVFGERYREDKDDDCCGTDD